MTALYDLTVTGTDLDDKLTATKKKIIDDNGYHWEFYSIIYGGKGNDTLKVSEFFTENNTISASLYGGDDDDVLISNGFLDYKYYGNLIDGGAGNDEFYELSSSDTVIGGDGFDIIHVTKLLEAQPKVVSGIECLALAALDWTYEINFSEYEELRADTEGQLTTISVTGQTDLSVTNFTASFATSGFHFVGSSEGERLDGRLIPTLLAFSGKGGDDTLIAGLRESQLNGGSGNDLIRGGDKADELTGETGNDLIWGGDGKDMLNGGSGDDTLWGGNGADTIYIEAGSDRAYGGNGNDSFNGRKGRAADHPLLIGGDGNDLFYNWSIDAASSARFEGGRGHDVLQISGDISQLELSSIEEIQFFGILRGSAELLDSFDAIIQLTNQTPAKIVLSEGGSFTWKQASKVRDGEFSGSSTADHIDLARSDNGWTVWGGNGDDYIKGASAYNELKGEYGNDTLVAGKKGAELDGGFGNDTLIGGQGNDNFQDHVGNDTIVIGRNSGRDHVFGFDMGGKDRDVIDLSEIRAIRNFDDLMENHLQIKGTGYLVTVSDDDTLYIEMDLYDLNESSFIFA